MYQLINRIYDPSYIWAIRWEGREVHVSELDLSVNDILMALSDEDHYYQQHEEEWTGNATPVLAVGSVTDFVAQVSTLVLLGAI